MRCKPRGAPADRNPTSLNSTSVNSEWARNNGYAAIDTWNGNAWHTCKGSATRSASEAVLLQEMKIPGHEDCSRAEDAAKNLGWQAKFNAAITTEKGGVSAGVGILAKKHVGMRHGTLMAAPRFRSRIMHSWLGLGRKGGVHVFSVYLWTSEGMSQRNRELLDELQRLTRLVKGPWIVGGDMNMVPEKMVKWATDNHATIFAPGTPTCNCSTIDYFIVHRSLADSVVGTQVISDLGGRPHFGVRLLIDTALNDDKTWTIKKPAAIGSVLPAGCKQHTPSYPLAFGLNVKSTLHEVSEAAKQWYDMAESEWIDILGLNDEESVKYRGRADGPSFVNKPPTYGRGSEHEGASDASSKWRTLAAWATVLMRETNLSEPPDGLKRHARELRAKILCKNSWKISDKSAMKDMHDLVDKLDSEKLKRKDCLSYLIKLATRYAQDVEDQTMHRRNKDWKAFVAGSANKCGKGAYLYGKGPTGGQSSPLDWAEEEEDLEHTANAPLDGEEDETDRVISRLPGDPVIKIGILSVPATLDPDYPSTCKSRPSSLQAAVELEAKTWAKLWKVGLRYDFEQIKPPEDQHPGDITATMLRHACLTFPIHTGLGADALQPRAILRLSDEGIEALARILTAIERTGEWPWFTQLVMTVLIPKSDGGLRPIGLFPTLYRVWMRCRRPTIKEWRKKHARAYRYGGAGRGAQRAAWLHAAKAEMAKSGNKSYATVLLDLVKAFETIPHKHIAKAAAKHGYNLWILRLSLKAYRVPRTIVVDGVCSTPQVASQGITAGSGFATEELACLLIDVCDDLLEAYPTLDLTEYVDDLTIGQAGPTWFIGDIIASATDFVIDILENQLGLTVSATKSAVVASSLKLMKEVAGKVQSGKVAAAKVTKMLGTATTSGRYRSVKVFKNRLKQTKAKGNRVRRLRRCGVNTAVWTRTAGLPGLLYSADISGVSDSMLKQQRSAIARIASSTTAGKNPLVTLWAIDCEGSKTDPAFAVHEMPLNSYAKACYEKWLPQELLQATFDEVVAELQGSKNKWNCAKGPIAAAVLTAQRIDWTFTNATNVTTDTGTELDLNMDSPAYVCQCVVESVRRRTARELEETFPALKGGGRGPITAGIRNAMRRNKMASKLHPKWGIKCKASLKSAVANGQWTQSRLFRAGLTTSDTCLPPMPRAYWHPASQARLPSHRGS